MRRGFKNRWERDQSPEGDGIVSETSEDGTIRRYSTLQELADRDKTPGQIKLLGKFGWHKSPNTTYKRRTYKRQELPRPLNPR